MPTASDGVLGDADATPAAPNCWLAVTVDPAFGPVLAVGLGGIWVEVLNDTSLRLLPVDAAEVRRMLGELRGLPLLQGARGAAPRQPGRGGRGDPPRSARPRSRWTARCAALEVNPLWVNR